MFRKVDDFVHLKKKILVLYYRVPRCNEYLAGLADKSNRKGLGV